MLPDVNLLVAAHHGDHPQHAVAAGWLSNLLDNASRSLVLPMPVLSGFFRVVTHPKIFQQPSSCGNAMDFVDWLLENTGVSLHGDASEWPAFRRLLMEKRLSANDIPNAWLAALSLSSSEPFVTFDKGFRKLLPRKLLVLLQPA